MLPAREVFLFGLQGTARSFSCTSSFLSSSPACSADGTVESRHPEDSKWFRLHVENKLAADAGVIKLAVAAIDADTRRAVYKQPLASPDSAQGETVLGHHVRTCFQAPHVDKQFKSEDKWHPLLIWHTLSAALGG